MAEKISKLDYAISSSVDPARPLANAFDGNTDTLWGTVETDTIADISFIGQDFPQEVTISRFRLRNAFATYFPTILRVKQFNGTWKTVQDFAVTTTLEWKDLVLDVPLVTSKVAVFAGSNLSGGSAFAVSEFEVYGYRLGFMPEPKQISLPVILSTMPAALTRGFR